MKSVRAVWAVMARELYGYVASPVAYVYVVIFLAVMGFFTWMLGGFFAANEASLEPFFVWHPWLYMLFVPAIGMRLWAEERRSGTLELLFTLPIAPWQAILGKFLAGSVMLGVSLALTFPMILTVNYLGDPDNGVIATGYLGSWLVAICFLAISSATSSLTRNQVVSFILSFVACLLLNLAGYPPVTDLFLKGEAVPLVSLFLACYLVIWLLLAGVLGFTGRPFAEILRGPGIWLVTLLLAAISAGAVAGLVRLGLPVTDRLWHAGTPPWVVDLVASFSIYPRFERVRIGVIDTRSLVYFISVIVFGLFCTGAALQNRRSS